RARPPARADERRAAAVDDVNRAVRYSAAVGRDGDCDENSPIADSVFDAEPLPHARCVPSPACGGGLGRGHAKRFICARFPPPHPSPASGGGCRPSPRLAQSPLHANGSSICICICICICTCICVCICITTLPQGRSDESEFAA